MTLTEFLTARFNEDDASAWAASRMRAEPYSHTRAHLEVEAKRRIVTRCSAVDYAMPSTHLAHGVLMELALPYADHPDFRPEWRP